VSIAQKWTPCIGAAFAWLLRVITVANYHSGTIVRNPPAGIGGKATP
jgi:hypothetical protein